MRSLPGLAAALAGLAGCGAMLPDGGTRGIALYDGAVQVETPQGYCVDPVASNAAAGFAVLGACARLGGSGAVPMADGFITLQVGEAGSAAVTGSETDLAALLRLPAGAALLTDADDPASVAITGIGLGEGVVSVRFSDLAPAPVEGLAAEEWRAFLDLGDRLVTVGLRGYARAPLSAAQAQGLLDATVAALRAANPPAAAVAGLRSGNEEAS
jgi:hypothetical protein